MGDKLNYLANLIMGEEKKLEEKKKAPPVKPEQKQIHIDPEKARKFTEGFNKKLGSL